jgi:hypothetical protein
LAEKTESIFPKLEENYLNAKYLFATFTIKNPKITDLRVVLSVMNKAANRLFKMKNIKILFLEVSVRRRSQGKIWGRRMPSPLSFFAYGKRQLR